MFWTNWVHHGSFWIPMVWRLNSHLSQFTFGVRTIHWWKARLMVWAVKNDGTFVQYIFRRCWLVVWNILYFSMCWEMLGIIIPIAELIFFRGAGIPLVRRWGYQQRSISLEMMITELALRVVWPPETLEESLRVDWWWLQSFYENA